jgi:hypothetical protein
VTRAARISRARFHFRCVAATPHSICSGCPLSNVDLAVSASARISLHGGSTPFTRLRTNHTHPTPSYGLVFLRLALQPAALCKILVWKRGPAAWAPFAASPDWCKICPFRPLNCQIKSTRTSYVPAQSTPKPNPCSKSTQHVLTHCHRHYAAHAGRRG